MKSLTVAAVLVAAMLPLATPSAAFDGFPDGTAFVRDNGWDDGWRERRNGFDQSDDMLSEAQVARRLMRQGFVRIDDIDRRRDRYIVRAVRPNGALLRLAVDAYDGEIIARERIGWVAGGRGYDSDYRRPVSGPTNGIAFDLGNGTLGFYSR